MDWAKFFETHHLKSGMDTVETHKLSQANNEAVCFDLF